MVKKLSLLLLFTLFPDFFYYAQTTVFAYIKDINGKSIEGVEVDMKGSSYNVISDKIGYFQFVGIKPGHYQIFISKPDYESQILEFDVEEGKKRKDLGLIRLMNSYGSINQEFTILNSTDHSDDLNNLSTVGFLQYSSDIFSSTAASHLGFYKFNSRGLNSRFSENILNGTIIIRPDNGIIDFSTSTILNEIITYPKIDLNHSPSEYGFGGIGSVFYKNTRASLYRKERYFTYSLANSNYNNSFLYRFSSGMKKNGWSFSGMITRRWAQEGIPEGTFYDVIGGYIGIEKKINDKHTVTFNTIGSSYRRSISSPNTQEVYDYRGANYNAYWGWQDQRKRSERIKTGFLPIIQLTDYWKINKKSKLWTTVSYQFGIEKSSMLNWDKAKNPLPTYYKNLPSYWINLDNPTKEQLENISITKYWWINNDQKHTQINWDDLYQKNLGNYDEKYGVRRALYFLENNVKNNKIWNISTHYNNNLSDEIKFILNISYQKYYSEQYREVKDLLGADFVFNIDALEKVLKDINLNTFDKNLMKSRGDKIGYDYIYRRNDINFNTSLKFLIDKFDIFFSSLIGYSNNSREDLFKYYLTEDSFRQKSSSQNFWNFGLKGQAIYKLNESMIFVYNGTYYSKAPFLDDIFINPRRNNTVSPNIRSTVINANDLSYIVSTPSFKLRITGYTINNENYTKIKRYFDDSILFRFLYDRGERIQSGDTRLMVSQVISNLNRRNIGVEIGIQAKITSNLILSGLTNIGQYTYTNNPKLYFDYDSINIFHNYNQNGNLGRLEYKDLGVSYLKNYKQGGMPQQSFSLGLKYSSPKFWWVSGNWNYFRDIYLEPSPASRTDFFVHHLNAAMMDYNQITEIKLKRLPKQIKLPEAFFLNARVGKSWFIGRYYFVVSGVINDILNNQRYITGGFEDIQYIKCKSYFLNYLNKNIPVLVPKYFYSQGRSYFITVQLYF